MKKSFRIHISENAVMRAYAGTLVLGALFLFAAITNATAPNPGHNFSEVGGGVVQGDILYGSAADTLSALAKNTSATRYLSNTGTTNNPAWAQVDLSNGVTGSLPLANGGTNASLSASNGGIVYSGSSAFAVLGGTATAGQILRSGASAAPSWSTATYPATVGTAGQVLMSNGTNWVSAATSTPTLSTFVPRNEVSTGAVTAATMASLTVFNLGLVTIPQQITVNQMTFTVSTVTTAGTMRLCVYNDAGTNVISVVSGTPAVGANNVTVSPAVVLTPGNYYLGIGCATTCSNAISTWTNTSVAGITAATSPAGKKVYVGTGTMTSGTCNASLPTVTISASKTPIFRLDN